MSNSRVLIVLTLVAGFAVEANAATAEETAAFFAQQRQEKVQFDQGILAEMDSRTAAVEAFNRQATADRTAFINSLPTRASQADLQSLSDFNAAALEKKRAFQATLPTLRKSKFEKAIEAYDNKAVADRAALNDQLADADPAVRSEAIRLFQNTAQQNRLQLKRDQANEISNRRNQFKQSQADKVTSFFNS